MEGSKIEWTDHTFNPWEGCTRVSPGCAHCYAEAQNHRWGKDNWGKGKGRRRTSAAYWKQPLKWNRDWQELNQSIFLTARPRVFCASLADWLDDEVPIEWLADVLKLIHATPNLDWLLLTKRPQNFFERVRGCLPHLPLFDGDGENWSAHTRVAGWLEGKGFDNVWIGTTVEDQKRADERIPALLEIPAKVRFLSVEPMLERIDLWLEGARKDLHWVIFGGESGRGARVCDVEWIRDGVRECRAAGVACFVKQLGARSVSKVDDYPCGMTDVGRDDVVWLANFKDGKGGDMGEWPADLRVREFPV